MNPFHILYPDNFSPDIESREETILGRRFVIEVFGENDPDTIPDDVWQRCNGMITGIGMAIGNAVLARVPNCRIVTRMGVGIDLVDAPFAGAQGIAVCNVPDYGTNEVADHALALLLGFARGITRYNQVFRDDAESGWDYKKAPALRLKGKTLGVIGLGRIGTAAALRAKAFGLDVIFHDPYVPYGQEIALGLTRKESLEELLGEADLVTIHTPLTEETHDLIDAAAVAAMKPGLILVNTARGPIIDIDALYDGLKNGQVGAAGLDVWPVEPAPADQKLVAAWRAREPWLDGRLIVTPHAAFYSPEGLVDMRDKALATVVDYLADNTLRNCMNLDLLKSGR